MCKACTIPKIKGYSIGHNFCKNRPSLVNTVRMIKFSSDIRAADAPSKIVLH